MRGGVSMSLERAHVVSGGPLLAGPCGSLRPRPKASRTGPILGQQPRSVNTELRLRDDRSQLAAVRNFAGLNIDCAWSGSEAQRNASTHHHRHADAQKLQSVAPLDSPRPIRVFVINVKRYDPLMVLAIT